MIEVNLLGTVTLLRDGTPFRLERRAQRLVMGLLALDAGQRVASSHLIEMLWGENAPASARATLHTRISEVRSLLTRRGLGDGVVALRTVDSGYCLEIDPAHVDGRRFLSLVNGWRQLPTARAALDRLAEALDLWRGPVFGGLLPEAPSAAVEALTAARLTALEDFFALHLHLGDHALVVDRLTEVANAHPTRERLTALCMIALARSGRAAEALTMYAAWRAWLREELGTDPDAEVQQVYLAIVRNEDPAALDPSPFPNLPSFAAAAPRQGIEMAADPGGRSTSAPAALPEPQQSATTPLADAPPLSAPPILAPRTLPPPIEDFTGRAAEVAELVGLIAGSSRRLIAVSGPAGVGKTALTVHVAHRVADRFPDGRLFVDLHGYDEQRPETAAGVLGRLLRALGVPAAAVPARLDGRVDLYRQTLADRRMLVILDNVAGDDQIAPLLSAGDACQVVVTGRTRLGATVGACQIAVRAMTDAEARCLLRRIAGDARIDADAHGTGELIRRCGNLPLALRIAGARLATKPHWSVAHLGQLLADDGTRLAQLTHQGLSVAAGIATSCRDLSARAGRLLRIVSTLDLPDVPVWVAAALLDTDARTAESLLEELFDASLAEVSDRAGPASSRYRLSCLVRDFGRERAAAEIGPARLREARERLYRACLSMLETGRADEARWVAESDVLDDRCLAEARDPASTSAYQQLLIPQARQGPRMHAGFPAYQAADEPGRLAYAAPRG